MLKILRMIGQCTPPARIVETVAAESKMARTAAEKLVNEAYQRILDAAVAPERMEDRLKLARVETAELITVAIESKNLSAATSLLRHKHFLDGLMPMRGRNGDDPPARGSIDVPGETLDEFDERSTEDLEFFNEKGCWPEEYKEPPQLAAAGDPLALLDKSG
jgi:hypothetical protein